LRSASTGRPQPPKAAGAGYPNSLAGASADADAAADEGKVTLIFCVIQPYFCMPPSACYYCIRTDKYYKTDEECKANCGPACNPQCPPRTSLNVSSIPS
jgi:hypothetical protein